MGNDDASNTRPAPLSSSAPAVSDRRDAGFQLRRQVDLRDQQQRLLSASQGTLDQPQVDFGLAAAGDPVQQVGMKACAGRADRRQRRLLLGGQFGRPLCGGGRPSARRAPLHRCNGAQSGRQRRQHHLAQRGMVVVGAELGQAKPVGGQRRQLAQDAVECLELLRGKIAAARQFHEKADFPLPAEGDKYAIADIACRQPFAIGDPIVEQAAQRKVEGDTGNLRRGHRVGKPSGDSCEGQWPVSGGYSCHFSQYGVTPSVIWSFCPMHRFCG